MNREFVMSRDVLGLRTNADYVGWSFGMPGTTATAAEMDGCRLVASLMEDPLDDASAAMKNAEKYHYWRGNPGSDELFYERTLFGSAKLRMHIRGVGTAHPEMRVNSSFLRFIRFRLNNLHSPGYHLTDIVCHSLLEQGLSPLHCSAFKIGDATVLVIAPPDSGKTLTTMAAALEYDASFMAEDLAITDGETLFACPWTSTFRYYDDLALGRWTKYRMALSKFFPPAEFLPAPDGAKTIDHYVGMDKIAWSSRITHVAILARRKGVLRDLAPGAAHRLVRNLNRYEFNYIKNPLLVAHTYFNPELDLANADIVESTILRKLTENARCMLVESADARQFAPMIIEAIAH